MTNLEEKVETKFFSEEISIDKEITKYFKNHFKKPEVIRPIPGLVDLSYNEKRKRCNELGYDFMCYKGDTILGGLSLQKHKNFKGSYDWAIYEIDLKKGKNRTRRATGLILQTLKEARKRNVRAIRIPINEEETLQELTYLSDQAIKDKKDIGFQVITGTHLLQLSYRK